jgi:phosphoribosylamine--glycine ligase
MNILLIGSGGREHALAFGLHASPSTNNLFVFPGNPGMRGIAQLVDSMSLNDPATIMAFCKNNAIDLVVVGPEAPLVKGLADDLRSHGIAVFGPSAKAARIESSKGFSKDLMKKYGIPTAGYERFTQEQSHEAHAYVNDRPLPIVIKADGLAAGKGVIIAETHDEAHEAIDEIFSGLFADAGSSIVIEDFLKGEEASVFAITDGEHAVLLAPAQDHKRAKDGDLGKNTGGMGAYAPAPLVTDEVLDRVQNEIVMPMLKAMHEEGHPFVGCLFVGLMIDQGKPSVVEFNCRFGDPETQAVLSVFQGDLARLLHSAAIGALDASAMEASAKGFACNVVMASGGYPDAYETGFPIIGLEEAQKTSKVSIFHAGTKALPDGTIVTAGGRVLGICGLGDTLSEAIENAYSGVEHIHYPRKYYRTDIGKKGLNVTNP